jgi:hypothetical protein
MTPTATARRRPAPERTAAPPKPHATFTHRDVTIKPSNLPPALTGFVCDALVLAGTVGVRRQMAWNNTARFVAHVRLTVGTVLAYDPGLVKKLFDEAGGEDAFRCHGPIDDHPIDHRRVGEVTLREFAGLSATGYDDDVPVDVAVLVPALFVMLKP